MKICFLEGDDDPSFHLKSSLVNPPAVEEATSLWYEMVIFLLDVHSHSLTQDPWIHTNTI